MVVTQQQKYSHLLSKYFVSICSAPGLKRFKIMSVPLSSFNIVTSHNLVWLILDVKINKIYNGDFRCAFIFKILISNI